MAGGGLERLSRHDRADRRHDGVAAPDRQLAGVWPRMSHFVLLPLATGIVTAIALRHVAPARLFDQAPHWWFVGVCYGAAAGIIFVVVVAVSRMGPYGEICWRDFRAIAGRFLPAGIV